MAPFYALLVGINKYKSPHVKNLQGCENDVRAVESLLMRRFGIPQSHIQILTDEQVTRANLIQALESHASHMTEQRSQTPSKTPGFLYYFSGHGSRAQATNTEDNYMM